MKMNELEAMREASFFQHLTRSDQIGCVQAKLGVLAATRRPFAGAFAVQPDTNPDQWLDADFFRSANGLLELLKFFDNDYSFFAELAPEQRDANKRGVLVAVADDQALGVFVHRERRDELRFAARFQTEMKLQDSIDN